jgi:NADH:ubiquinone oxidoreductase subunit F (NADH-binding)/NAD-dependent dihydropyrimidine dehydrogenase PreA subunit/(2Fe-2S) ferredoxin
MGRLTSISDLVKLREDIAKRNSRFKATITLCGGTGCRAYGSEDLRDSFEKELRKSDLDGEVRLMFSGCHGFCERGPLVIIRPEGILYCGVKEEDAPSIISETVVKGEVIDSLLYEDPVTGEKIAYEKDIPFYKAQKRIVFGQNGLLDPTVIEDYMANGGYGNLCKVLTEMEPEDVISEIKSSGLRGRGGAGFPTGRKWESCRRANGDVKYVVCNCDEGDPGAYMDRSLLEGNPHLILEGMLIGAYAIGAQEGYIYVRHEYPRAWENASIAIDQARGLGLLGENILGSGFSFDVQIARGGGAFVCGESTALIASLEGRPGEPRDKQHLHTTESGLWGRPTNLNNVETWANVPIIIDKGAAWYSQVGTSLSKGTKIFSLVGKVKNTGLVEVPMGTTLREIVYDIGGGTSNGKGLKAIQTGGPSGGCIPKELLDLPVDYEELTRAGSMMGSGGMIVMDESTCMVDVSRYFLKFLMEESCGKCLPCREGIKRMYQILTNIVEGQADEGHLEVLEELAWVVKESSLCGLGKSAPNPVLSTLLYFRSEYEAHVEQKKCPAGVCTALITYLIDPEACTGCGACAKVCPHEAIQGERKKPHEIDPDLCTRCGSCIEVCKFGAVLVE